MDLAWLSLLALLVVIVFSCTTKVNPGILAIAFAWIIGVYVAPLWYNPIGGLPAVIAGFPTSLLLTLIGVSLFFAQAQLNGTLERLAHAAVGLCRGNVGLIGLMFFFLTFVFSAVGAGNIAAAALIAPMAMTLGQRAGISAFLIVILVAHGSLAGALFSIAPTGIIANQQMTKIEKSQNEKRLLERKLVEKELLDKSIDADVAKKRLGEIQDIKLTGHEGQIFFHNLVGNAVVGVGGYLLFGGWRLFRFWYNPAPPPESQASAQPSPSPMDHWERRHVVTLALMTILIVSVIFFKVDVGMGAFCGSALLTLGGWADEREAVRKIPWGVILMVCGVTVLTSLLEKTGGTERFKDIIKTISTPGTVTGVVAAITGVVSVYSSTSGVVLPAFLPIAVDVGGDPLAVSLSIIVGGHLVDSSPLSTIGALCIAAAPPQDDRNQLFNRVLAWGMSMALLGAVYCNVMFGLLWPAS